MAGKLDAETWRRAEALFEQAVELPKSERTEFLERECTGDNAELRPEIESWLAADESDYTFLDAPPLGEIHTDPALVDSELQVASDLKSGDRLGDYRLVREIGFGGMSRVYLAERDETYRRQVAIKVVEAPLQGPSSIRRFQLERQILAALNHPSIARLYDGGETPGGKPYFVLEYVDGMPIDGFCDVMHSTLKERIELMIEVCEAVSYAHQHLIVHRDLKPGNILVTRETDTEGSGASAGGQVKLLDFGIAKVLEPELLQLTVDLTRTGHSPMTLQYASPEQVQGGSVTTATDVYSLGTVLYQLLSGGRPYELSGLSPSKIEEVVCRQEPPAPSLKAAEMARQGRLPSRVRAAQLAGDLDNIALMALAKDPSRRYGTAQQLADDLRRYLDGRPVVARAPTWWYRSEKFIRRHWGSLAVALLFCVMFGIFSVTLWRQNLDLERQRDSARESQQEAQREKAKAEQTTRFLIDTFSQADPTHSKGQAVTAEEILKAGVRTADEQKDVDPEIRIDFLFTMAEAYKALGEYSEAVSLLEIALEDSLSLYGENHEETATIRHSLADCYVSLDNYAAATAHLRSSLETRLEIFGEDHVATAQSWVIQARLLYFRSAYPQSRELLTQAVKILTRDLGSAHSSVLEARKHLAFAYREPDLIRQREEMLDRLLTDWIEIHGEDHVQVAKLGLALSNTILAREDGRLGDAEKVVRRSLGTLEKIYGPEHPETARAKESLAACLQFTDPEAALQLSLEVLAVDERVGGSETWHVGLGLATVGTLELVLGNLEAAEEYLRRSVKVTTRAVPPQHWAHWYPVTELGRVLLLMGRASEAEPLLRQSSSYRSRSDAQWRGHYLESQALWGLSLMALGELETATEELEDVLQSLEKGGTFRETPLNESLEEQVREALGI